MFKKRLKIFIVLGVFLFSITVLTNIISAKTIPIQTMYMVDAGGSTAQIDTFHLSDTPWLYIQIPKNNIRRNDVQSMSSWNDSSGNVYKVNETDTGVLEVWHYIANWNSIKKAGLWTVDSGYAILDKRGRIKDSGSGSASFIVLQHGPEPVSSILIVTGGCVFVFRQIWKKRRNA